MKYVGKTSDLKQRTDASLTGLAQSLLPSFSPQCYKESCPGVRVAGSSRPPELTEEMLPSAAPRTERCEPKTVKFEDECDGMFPAWACCESYVGRAVRGCEP